MVWFLILLLSLSINIIKSDQYIYPVATFDERFILCVFQKDLDFIDLMIVDSQTNSSYKQLPSYLYFPTNIIMIPDKSGYSFIDRGFLYIVKTPHKRNARRIEWDMFISGIRSFAWIDHERYIFSAFYNQQYVIYLGNIDGQIESLFIPEEKFLQVYFPVITEDGTLESIMHDEKNNEYYIKKTCVANRVIEKKNFFSINKERAIKILPNQILAAYFFIEAKTRGFLTVLEEEIHSNRKDIVFECYLTSQEDETELDFAFSLKLPKKYIMQNPDQLFEALQPLIPKVIKNKVVYSTLNDNQELEIRVYDPATKQNNLLFYKNEFNLFAPILVDEQIFFGYQYNELNKDWHVQDHYSGNITTILPSISTPF